jgi:DNA primase
MSIPEEKIQEIRDRIDIVEVVSQHVTLKRRGKSFVGLCPFHGEKTPSFHVDPVRGFYHCFGCGVGGNVFTFVMQMEKISFPEAVKMLAGKAGVSIPEISQDDERTKEIEELYQANQMAADFFRKVFLETEEGKQAQEYLFTRRKFAPSSADLFKIGYAPAGWDGLIRKAQSVSMKPEMLFKAGLVVPRKDGKGYYDRFRSRLMFPIQNPAGKVVGFGGRILKDDPRAPKYLNSPETAVYQKSRILYGLHQSKGAVQKENCALLVEGYLDLIRMMLAGFENTVATSGTALTEGHAILLSRYTKNTVLVFDGDSAGFAAALRGVEILAGAGLSVRVAPLQNGTDPDTFLIRYGKSAMEQRIQSARHFIDFYIEQAQEKHQITTVTDRAGLARSILAVISKVSDPIERNLMIKQTAEKLGLDETVLFNELSPARQGVPPQGQPVVKNASAQSAAEEGLLYVLVEDGATWAKSAFRHIRPEQFRNREAREVVTEIFDGFSRGNPLSAKEVLDRVRDHPETLQFLTAVLARVLDSSDNRTQFVTDCLIRMKQEEIQEEIDRIRFQIQGLQQHNQDWSEATQEYFKQKKRLETIRAEIAEDLKKQVENG